MNHPTTPDPGRERWTEIEAILDMLLEAEPSRWPELLDEACAGDDELRHEVEELLLHHDPSRDFLRGSAAVLVPDLVADEPAAPESTASMEGRPIGAYRIVREIGRGGMGRVFLADRADGEFERRVALKLLRPGLDEAVWERRFRSERRILASLEHPNIARLLDGGITDEGLSWLAMEYVEGSPIHEYCEGEGLGIRRRLELFTTLTSAVQYAHRNLVIHRDLKPSNIHVAHNGQLKLLDFGIAKLLPEDGGSETTLTRPGQRFLTPEYCAPEQVRAEPVTTATDVYQLGVVLYELLTGRRPFEATGRSLHDLEEAILRDEPEKPSTAASGQRSTGRSGAGQIAVGAQTTRDGKSTVDAADGSPSLSSDRLRRALTGDLDAIVLKALRKDPEARYASAGEMGDDVRRYLAGLPVLAHEGSRAYRLRKFVSRQRGPLTVAAALTLLLAGTGTAYTIRVTQERDRARLEADKSDQVTRFLMGLFEANDPREARGDSVSARQLLERGMAQVEALGAQPEVQAQMLDVVGQVYTSLGRYADARPLLERALATRRERLGPEHPDVAASLDHLATVLERDGDYDAAEPLLREALAVRRQAFGEEHPEVARSLAALGGLLNQTGDYDAAEPLMRSALAMQRRLLGNSHLDVASSLNSLGLLLTDKRELDEAEAVHREALAIRRELLGEDHLDVAYSLNNLALVYHIGGNFEAAEPLYREVMAIDRRLLGEDHPDYALDLNNLGGLLGQMGQYEEAERLHREALAIYRRTWDPPHPRIAQSLNNMAGVLYRSGDVAGAADLYRDALAMRRELLGNDHPDVATTLTNLAVMLDLLGQKERAEPLFREAIRVSLAALGDENPVTAIRRSELGALLIDLARYDESEALLLEADVVLQRERGRADPITRRNWDRLVELYGAWNRPDDAARYRSLLEAADSTG